MGYGIVMAKSALDFTGDDYINAVSVTSVQPTGATITWQTTLPSTGAVQYGALPFSLPPAPSTDSVSGLAHTVTLTGLSPNTTYSFRVHAVTVTSSLNMFGPDSLFKTPLAATGAPALTATSATASTTASTVKITVTLKNTGAGPANAVIVSAATLNSVATLTSPLPSLGTVASGATTTFSLTFPASAVVAGGSGRGQGNVISISTKTTGPAPTYGFTNPVSVTGL
jgi:hypothetical protein